MENCQNKKQGHQEHHDATGKIFKKYREQLKA